MFPLRITVEDLEQACQFPDVIACFQRHPDAAAVGLFLLGVTYRMLKWAQSAVPFRIPTSCGQQKTLPFMKNDNLENPHNLMGVLGRMALEILFFRSLFRNTKTDLTEDNELVYSRDKWLWGAALLFHWSFLLVLLRHYRFIAEPVPSPTEACRRGTGCP